ncbi:MAG: cheZ [Roseomonas sp.]|nr:cheZ [Roseomonas sp.]
MNVTSSPQAAPQQGLARIAGHVAAISGEVDRLLGLRIGVASEGENLAQAITEMRNMAKLLAETRAEIVGLSPPPTGLGDTLDAVVAETERAAMEIMQQAERAQAAAGRLHAGTSADTKADLAEVDDAATCILMACAFQDITGQRIGKVLSAMRYVESRIATLVALMGIGQEERPARMDGAAAGSDAALLNGPSSGAEGGLGQTAVDDLFS